MKKRMKDVLFVAVLFAMVLAPFDYICNVSAPVRIEEPENESIIKRKEEQLEVSIETEEVEVEETITIEPNPMFENIRFYDVPLSKELQLFVFMECDGYSFWTNIPIAIMDVESDFDLDAVSPRGAVGPMQVVEEYHWDRMELLGCDDLFDPYQNIKVAMHYLAYLRDKNPDICWVLMAYRHGEAKATELYNRGIVDEYALEVLARAAELQIEMEERYGSN